MITWKPKMENVSIIRIVETTYRGIIIHTVEKTMQNCIERETWRERKKGSTTIFILNLFAIWYLTFASMKCLMHVENMVHFQI